MHFHVIACLHLLLNIYPHAEIPETHKGLKNPLRVLEILNIFVKLTKMDVNNETDNRNTRGK